MEALCVLDTITANKTVQIQAADERRSKIHGCCVVQLGPEKYSKKYVEGFPANAVPDSISAIPNLKTKQIALMKLIAHNSHEENHSNERIL